MRGWIAPNEGILPERMRRLILASGSPRRAELLKSAGFAFDVCAAEIDESPLASEAASDYVDPCGAREGAVRRLWIHRDWRHRAGGGHGRRDQQPDHGKASERRGRRKHAGGAVGNGSPGAHRRGRAGRTRASRSSSSRRASISCRSRAADIAWYVATGEPGGKAGAYAIQGCAARFIDWIDGSWSNVVGLPLATVSRMLEDAGFVD